MESHGTPLGLCDSGPRKAQGNHPLSGTVAETEKTAALRIVPYSSIMVLEGCCSNST